jgi:uncharacterized OsmC-like protein
MATNGMLNGIDVQAMRDVIGAVKENTTLAETQFRAHNQWVEGAHCRAHVKSFYMFGSEDASRTTSFTYEMDEPPALLGHNAGANPTEMALVALSGCLTTTLIVYAAAKGYTLESVESHLAGDLDLRGFFGLDETIGQGYSNIHVSFDIKGDVSENQKQELIELAQKYSPVFATITTPVKVDVTLAGQTHAEAA